MSRKQFLAAFLFLICAISTTYSISQGQVANKSKTSKPANTKTNSEVDEEAAQRRMVAVSLVISLADEAKSFKDQTRRARVQARAADVLWETDPERARELFRRAWDAAIVVDEENIKAQAEELGKLGEGRPIKFRNHPDLRNEVLRLVAKRDKQLGEEFLKVLEEAAEKERNDAAAAARRNSGESSLAASKRLQLARRLVQDGEVERAMEFAGPALDRVSMDSIIFLSELREKNARMADTGFASLMAQVARDPSIDANTISGL